MSSFQSDRAVAKTPGEAGPFDQPGSRCLGQTIRGRVGRRAILRPEQFLRPGIQVGHPGKVQKRVGEEGSGADRIRISRVDHHALRAPQLQHRLPGDAKRDALAGFQARADRHEVLSELGPRPHITDGDPLEVVHDPDHLQAATPDDRLARHGDP